jgi:transcriptional regulatory protein LevR
MDLDSALARRLGLLQESGQIDADIAEFMAWALAEIERRLGLAVREDSFGTLCTHTAMALQRARNGDQIESWDSQHEELESFPEAVSMAESIADAAEERLGASLSTPEREFIALHVASVSQRSG